MIDWMARATAFELLSLAFLPPKREAADALASGEFADACNECLGLMGLVQPNVTELLKGYPGADADATYHELRQEHAHLFVGSRTPLITPYVGIWAAQGRGQKGLLFVGKESMAIERFMHARGVAKNLGTGQSNDPLDHLGTCCEFLKYLCLVNARAVQVPDGFMVAEGDYGEFLCGHFAEYALWCAAELQEKARTPFYRAMGAMLGAVCQNDRQ